MDFPGGVCKKARRCCAHIYIEAALDILANFPFAVKSVTELHKNLKKFFLTYVDGITLLLSKSGDIPDTTVLLELKNTLLARSSPF